MQNSAAVTPALFQDFQPGDTVVILRGHCRGARATLLYQNPVSRIWRVKLLTGPDAGKEHYGPIAFELERVAA